MKNFTTFGMPANMDGIVPGTIFYPVKAFTSSQLSEIFGEEAHELSKEGYIMIEPNKQDTPTAKLLVKFSSI